MSDAIQRVERYIREHEDAPSWGGPTSYPSPPSIDDLKALLSLAKNTDAVEAAKKGWLACRRQVFGLCEHTVDRHEVNSGDFAHGGYVEAKNIAKAMNAFGPDDCDELAKVLAPLQDRA